MLLFICVMHCFCNSFKIFQYISCYCLSVLGFAGHIGTLIFQYISCYCLSFPFSILLSVVLHFNTSHVTVYPFSFSSSETFVTISIHLMLLFILPYRLFKNNLLNISIHLMLLFIYMGDYNSDMLKIFQYISCYCLSFGTILIMVYYGYFNTSHVTVYQCVPLWESKTIRYFNTSHVTVYQNHNVSREILKGISIHLMLLFIAEHIIEKNHIP